MADETGVTVLLTDGSEEHFEQAATWTSRDDGGLLLISHDNGENQKVVAEYLPGRAVRVCHGPPFRIVEEGNAGPDDEKAAIYEAGFKAGQDAARAEHGEASSANKAQAPVPRDPDGNPEAGAVPEPSEA